MTIQMLRTWGGYEQFSIQSLGATEEARLIAAGLARDYVPGMDSPPSSVSGDVARATNNIVFIGDSRSRYGRRHWHKSAGVSDSKGIQADWLGVGPLVTVDASTGTLEYRAADKSMRWTAPSDPAGPWIACAAGAMTLQSASADRELYMILLSVSTLPATDQTVTVTCTGVLYAQVTWTGHATDVMSRYRNGPTAYYLGAGGAATSHLADLATWYAASVTGPGVDVIRIGTNDISGGATPAGVMSERVTALAQERLDAGRHVVLVGETARWGVNTSTPLTAGQLDTMIAYNTALRAWAEARASRVRYVDTYSLTRDPAAVDGRPAAGMLTDHVHDAPLGAITVGAAVYAAIQSLGGLLVPAPYPAPGDAGVVFANSSTWMHLSGGDASTGVGGTLPGGISASRASGTDLTAVASVVSYSDQSARQVQLDITSTTANNILGAHSNLPSGAPTLATMGLAAGDTIYFDVDVEVVSGAPSAMDFFINLPGSNRRTQITFPSVAGRYHQRSAPIKLLASDTTIRQMSYITMPAAATASVRFGQFVTRKA